MINENIALALLQASITGAGLILAVYALLIPVAKQIFERKTLELKRDIEIYRKESEKINWKITSAQIQKIMDTLSEIKGKTTPPEYMRIGIGVSFIGYILSTLMSIWWLLNWNKTIMDKWLPIFFGVTTFVFLIVGFFTIKDIYSVFRKKYEDLKSEIKEEKVNVREDVDKSRNYIPFPSSPQIEKPSNELREKLDEFNKKSELLEMLEGSLKPEDYFYRGIDLFYKNKYEYSLKAFEKAIELQPDFAEAWHNKGVVLTKLGRSRDAHKAFEEAGRLNPNFAQRHLFNWDEMPGNDSARLFEFLEKIFNIDWIKTAKIEKTDDGKTIKIYTEKKSLSFRLNDEKTQAILTIDEGRNYIYTAKMINDKLNICTGINRDFIVKPSKGKAEDLRP